MKIDKEFKSKLLISSIKLLIPNFDKSFYLNIVVNEDKTYKTNKFEFKKSNTVNINQVFELEGINSIDVIRFQFYEKTSIFSNALFKGEVTKSNRTKDDSSNQLICFLSNNNQENCVVVYFNYELNPDLLDTFDHNLKLLEEEQKIKNEHKSQHSNLRELARGDNAENFAKFVHNQEYVRSIETTVDEFINWKNPWKTLAILFLFTYSFVNWKISFILSPLILIYFHLYNRENMNAFSHKSTKHDNLANMTIITKTIDIINDLIDSYENFLEAMQYSDKKIYEEIYVNLIKLIFFNVIVIYFRLFRFKLMLLISVWSFILWNNPSFRAFVIFLPNFINKKFLSKLDTFSRINTITNLFVGTFFLIVPFADIIRKIYKIKKEYMTSPRNKSDVSRSASDIKLKEVFENLKDKTVILSNDIGSEGKVSRELIKFEIYENERWWMFVGWAKNLIMNERPLWSDISGKIYKDKNSVFLPNNGEYQWEGDWRLEASDNCDEHGWEYSSDFKSDFGPNSRGKYVRRRKWVRYAKMLTN